MPSCRGFVLHTPKKSPPKHTYTPHSPEIPGELWAMVLRFAVSSLEDVTRLSLVSQRFRSCVLESTVGLVLQKGEGCHGDASNRLEFSRVSDSLLMRVLGAFPSLQSLTMQHAVSVTAAGLVASLRRERPESCRPEQPSALRLKQLAAPFPQRPPPRRLRMKLWESGVSTQSTVPRPNCDSIVLMMKGRNALE